MDMAPSVLDSSSDPSRLINRNPLPLTASQEAQVRDIYYKKVRSECAKEIADFAACARSRTFSLAYACKSQQLAMNSCMISHSGAATEDAAREEWFAGVAERRRKKEEELAAVEVRRKEVIDMTRRQETKEMAEEEAKRRDLDLKSGRIGGGEEVVGKKAEGGKGWWR